MCSVGLWPFALPEGFFSSIVLHRDKEKKITYTFYFIFYSQIPLLTSTIAKSEI